MQQKFAIRLDGHENKLGLSLITEGPIYACDCECPITKIKPKVQMQFNTPLFTFSHIYVPPLATPQIWLQFVLDLLGLPNQGQPASMQKEVVMHIKVFSICQKHRHENNIALMLSYDLKRLNRELVKWRYSYILDTLTHDFFLQNN